MTKCSCDDIIDSSELNHRVQVQRRVETRNPEGDIVESWATEFSTWAMIQPLRGRERWLAHQVRQDVTHKVFMRYREGVTPDHRVRFGFRNLNIESVINVSEANQMLELVCIEDVS